MVFAKNLRFPTIKVCFICALHLCNEKNLELKTDPANPLGDFAIVAEES